jgi:hypothetical protein
MTRAEDYRGRARECEQQAERARDASIKDQWLDMARQWHELAKKTEQQQGS